MSEYKPGFNWTDRTISPPSPDGTRWTDIMIRLDEINQERMRTLDLPVELQRERAELIEELYQIGMKRFERFKETGGR